MRADRYVFCCGLLARKFAAGRQAGRVAGLVDKYDPAAARSWLDTGV